MSDSDDILKQITEYVKKNHNRIVKEIFKDKKMPTPKERAKEKLRKQAAIAFHAAKIQSGEYYRDSFMYEDERDDSVDEANELVTKLYETEPEGFEDDEESDT